MSKGTTTIQKIKKEQVGLEKGKSSFIDTGTAANDPSTVNPFNTTDHNPIVNAEQKPDDTVEGKIERIKRTKDPDKCPELEAKGATEVCSEYKVGECESGKDLKSGCFAPAKTGRPGFAAQTGIVEDKDKLQPVQPFVDKSTEITISEEVPESPKSFCQAGEPEGIIAITGSGCPGLHASYDCKHALTFKETDLTVTISEQVAESTNEKCLNEQKCYTKIPEEDNKSESSNGCHGFHTVPDGKNHCTLKVKQENAELSSHEERTITTKEVLELKVRGRRSKKEQNEAHYYYRTHGSW